MRALEALRRNLGPLTFVLLLILGVSLLPSDTSLREVQRAGLLRACVPASYPPLVTGDPARPGIDVEILKAVAGEMGVSPGLNVITAMGRDFNPRNWRVSRGHCAVIIGGVVNAPLTRSFLEVGPPYAETGWATLAPAPIPPLAGQDVAVLTLISGLDRIGLASFLRQQEARPRVMRRAEDLEAALSDGTAAVGVTEALLARHLAHQNGWEFEMLPPPLPRYDVVFGLWKGDLTLKRAVRRAFDRLQADGTIPAILESYLGEPELRAD